MVQCKTSSLGTETFSNLMSLLTSNIAGKQIICHCHNTKETLPEQTCITLTGLAYLSFELLNFILFALDDR